MTETTRMLPHDLDSEKAILGAVLLHSPALYEALQVISKDDLYLEAHRKIIASMVRLQAAGTGIDALTVKADLERAGDLEKIGGPAYLASLTDGIPGVVNVRHYAGVIRERAILRRVIQAGSAAIERAYQAEDPAQEIVDGLQGELFRLAEDSKRGGWLKIADLVHDAYQEIDALAHRKTLITGIDTGFPELNKLTQGLHPGQLVIVAGRPGHGKTSLGLNLAANAILRQGKKVGLFTLEMSAMEITKRIICAEAEVDSHRVGTGFVGRDDWTRISEAAGRIAESNLSVDESGNLTITDVRSRAQHLAVSGGLDLLIVDYLQLMAGVGHRGDRSRVQEISEISRGLKALAKDLGIPVVAMSQLNREVEKEAKRRPRLSDLRESGSIEQDADVVLFIWREELRAATEENAGQAELIIGKQRNGPLATLNLFFQRQFTRFVSAAPQTVQEQQREMWYEQG